MIHEKLNNGLEVIIERREQTALAAVNLLYKVGSAHEKPGKTGMAHLLEHLMFEGTAKFPHFDEAIHALGGENNAYTTNDYTNYYEIIPATHIEQILKIEADRMTGLKIGSKKFLNQQKVVIEEFKETHLNLPYGMSWHQLCDMMYPVHPYHWPVIGYSMDEIAAFSLQEVQDFYATHYAPDRAVLSVVGNLDEAVTMSQVKTYFEGLSASNQDAVLQDPIIAPHKIKQISREQVPQKAIHLAVLTPPRFHTDFYAMDLCCDVLSNGQSSIFYEKLYKEQKLFSEIDAYVTANIGQGMLVVEGKLNEGIEMDLASQAIHTEIQKLMQEPIEAHVLEKVKNKAESFCVHNNYQLTNRAANLALFAAYDKVEHLQHEHESYLQIQQADIPRILKETYKEGSVVELQYDGLD